MNILNQVFFAGAILTTTIALVLIAVFFTKRELLTGDEAIGAFKENVKVAGYIAGFLLISLSLHLLAEIMGLFEMGAQIYLLFETFHVIFLLLALALMARLTYAMGWRR